MSQTDMFPTSQAPQEEKTDKAEDNPALQRWMERRDRLAAIPLAEVLEALGGSPNRRDRNKWKIEGVGNIVFKGQRWLNGNTNESGFGSVSLVRHVNAEEKDTAAMNWLAQRYPSYLEGEWVPPVEEEEKETGFTPPERSDQALPDIRDYLVGRRGLPAELVDAEIAAGRIYATDYRSRDDETGEWSSDLRAVFVGPSSAELRSTNAEGFKGCCPGSDSERSGYQVMFRGESDRHLGLVEAAITALSYNAMHPGRYSFSTNGAGRFHLNYRLTLEAWRNGFSTDLALDADQAGDQGAQLVFNALALRDRLAEQAGVAPEQVDEWFLTNKITFSAMVSDHHLFLSQPPRQGQQDQWAVLDSQVDPEDRSKHIVTDTGTSAPATVAYRVNKACGPIKAARYELTLTPDEIQQVQDAYRVARDRPVLGNDWNDTWKKLSRQAELNRAAGVPSSAPEAKTDDTTAPTGRYARRLVR